MPARSKPKLISRNRGFLSTLRGRLRSEKTIATSKPGSSRASSSRECRASSSPPSTLVVVVDSALETPHIVSFIATDNKRGGALAADRLGELLGGSGTVLLLRYQEGSASTEEREKGFAQRLRQAFPNIKIILSAEFAGATRDSAKRAAGSLLSQYGDDLRGVFTPNESSTAGMLMALSAVQKAGRIILVGFDSSDVYVDSLRHKQLHGLVVQDPFRMGELGVKTLVDHLTGKSVPKRVDTGATMVTLENMDRPEIQKLLRPPVQGI
jgi:ribose transport system substrate-binding protein